MVISVFDHHPLSFVRVWQSWEVLVLQTESLSQLMKMRSEDLLNGPISKLTLLIRDKQQLRKNYAEQWTLLRQELNKVQPNTHTQPHRVSAASENISLWPFSFLTENLMLRFEQKGTFLFPEDLKCLFRTEFLFKNSCKLTLTLKVWVTSKSDKALCRRKKDVICVTLFFISSFNIWHYSIRKLIYANKYCVTEIWSIFSID